MSFTMFRTWVLVGVLAGVLAPLVMKRGGYGLQKDIFLGLAGSIGASWIFRAVGGFPEAGIGAMVVVAAIGAAIPIVAQRKFWPTESAGEEKTVDQVWRGGGRAGGGGARGRGGLRPPSAARCSAGRGPEKS